ncbi:MAG: CobW family GTP-binding protein [Oscillospiraceae bacterium]|nr:CobW family GTP-binding protein [Oscillospiraceae bacterium]
MTKIDIISGFLGAGKTTLIKKLLEEAYGDQKLVLIENEFGEIAIDGGFLKDSGIQINELNSGCICCSLVGDFGEALKQVITEYHPDRVLIEPSGVGKLSDVIRAVQRAGEVVPLELGCFVTVVNAPKAKVFMKNFGEFFNDQVEHAGAIILSRTQGMKPEKLDTAVALLREKNPHAPIITTPWDQLTGPQMLAAMEGGHSMVDELLAELAAEAEDEEDECDDPDCSCHDHHHHHDHDEHEHHHDHEHEHEHEHDHDHHHHHHHHADEVFTSWGVETPKKFTQAQLEEILEELDLGTYGVILRAKGILPAEDGTWLHFDYTPNEVNIRTGSADYTGRLCVIGSDLKEDGLKTLFGV